MLILHARPLLVFLPVAVLQVKYIIFVSFVLVLVLSAGATGQTAAIGPTGALTPTGPTAAAATWKIRVLSPESA